MARSILIVDDERTIADTLALILRHVGYIADAVYSGEEAIEYIERAAPDLVISDVMMPGINGIDLAVRIRQTHAACQVLLISGNATSSDLLEQARATGCTFPLLAKPVHPADLLNQIAGLIPREAKTVQKAEHRSKAA